MRIETKPISFYELPHGLECTVALDNYRLSEATKMLTVNVPKEVHDIIIHGGYKEAIEVMEKTYKDYKRIFGLK